MAPYLRLARPFSAWIKVAFAGGRAQLRGAKLLMSTMRLFRVTLEVGDAEKASTFYRALFGQRPRPVGGGRSYVDCGPAILALLTTGERPRGIPQYLYFEVDDLDAVHARASDLGALSAVDVHGHPGGEILIRPWGERSFYAEDPWGNGLCFVQSGTLFTGE
jgi:catechol 2,3-dioxygenase-like lactoylglutathione lyase family enzyme